MQARFSMTFTIASANTVRPRQNAQPAQTESPATVIPLSTPQVPTPVPTQAIEAVQQKPARKAPMRNSRAKAKSAAPLTDIEAIVAEHLRVGMDYNVIPGFATRNRTISAPAVVFDILRQRIEYNRRNKELLQGDYHDHGLIVCSDNGMPLSPKNFSARFCNLLKRLKIKRVRFHDLRHSGASMMLRAGVDMKVVSSILGHSSIKITADVYLHILEEMKLDAAAKVENLIARALDNMGQN